MARRRKGNRVPGPYYQKRRKRWQVIRVAADGETGVEEKTPYYFTAEAEALAFRRLLDEEDPENREGMVSYAIDQYEVAKRKPGRRTMATCLARLNGFFDGMKGHALASLTIDRLQERLTERIEGRKAECAKKKIAESFESLISETRDVRVFLRWCGHSKRRWVSQELVESPDELRVREHVDNLVRKTGKTQLTFDEAVRYLGCGLKLVRGEVKAPDGFGNLAGHHGPIVALLPLTSGITGREIFGRVVRDLDQGGAMLIVKGGKTRNRDVPVAIPEELHEPLQRLVVGRKPNAVLFAGKHGGKHHNTYGGDWVRRLCKWAGVTVV